MPGLDGITRIVEHRDGEDHPADQTARRGLSEPPTADGS